MKLFIYLVCITVLVLGMQPRKTEAPADFNNVVYCKPSFDPSKVKQGNAPLINGLGNIHYAITTSSKKAQQYFDQGLALTYGFNHGEAARSYIEASRIDSSCAMAYWGLAFVLGPNYNAALNPSSLEDINSAIDKAVYYSPRVSAKEKALIAALALRFPRQPVSDMTPYNDAYAASMKKAYESFPGDLHISTLYADALMNQHPWDLWKKDGSIQSWTPAIMDVLEGILAKDGKHPGAIHYYIHVTEASPYAAKALPFADRLRDAMPAAGHLVHMPSHTYLRTGDYHKGVIANEKASKADSTYIAQCKAQGAYPLLYYPHNIHFLAACAFLEGNSKKALTAAWDIAHKTDKIYIQESITVQHYFSIPYYTMVHLGRWKDILSAPAPDSKLKYPTAIWHYARGMAYAAQKNEPGAKEELSHVKQLIQDEWIREKRIWDINLASDIITIAANVLEAEIIAGTNPEKAITLLKEAVVLEDKLNYTEPPDWFFSVRHTLGHVLVQAGRFKEAEEIYRQDLVNLPENGWALKGLFNSLAGQGKKAEADAVNKRFEKAWAYADVKIKSSRVY